MSGQKIRLSTYAMSPYAAKVHCFLLYKKLDFECFYIVSVRPSAGDAADGCTGAPI